MTGFDSAVLSNDFCDHIYPKYNIRLNLNILCIFEVGSRLWAPERSSPSIPSRQNLSKQVAERERVDGSRETTSDCSHCRMRRSISCTLVLAFLLLSSCFQCPCFVMAHILSAVEGEWFRLMEKMVFLFFFLCSSLSSASDSFVCLRIFLQALRSTSYL